MRGLFITFEGGDGSGKTSQINLLKKYFEQQGKEVIITREPGGTVISEKVREIILDINNTEMSDITEALLYAAARAQHVNEVIEPAIKEGKIVICDRFVDSSVVYQGYARQIGIDMILKINDIATNGLVPDLTFYLDLEAKIGLNRKKNQAELDRLEVEKIEFHENVISGYRELANRNPDRIITIDATLTVEEIYNKVVQTIKGRY
ncbi:MAG: tmk [Clostridiales bacterium]|jgi:dTMP kinase|nr:tmk [Clostridiales bacterium]